MVDDRRTRRTRSLIRDAMLKCLEVTSLDKITVKQICEVADINRSTFYTYYSDPLMLYQQIEDAMIFQMNEAVSDFRSKHIPYELLLKRLLTCFSENSDVFLALLRSRSESFRHANLELLRSHDFFSDTLSSEDRKLAEEYYTGGLMSIISAWLQMENRHSVEYMSSFLQQLTKNRIS